MAGKPSSALVSIPSSLGRRGPSGAAEWVAQQYVNDIRLLGILSNWISQSQVSTPAGLPVITQVGISSVSDGQKAVAAATAGWKGDGPLFVAIGVLALNMTPTDVNTLAASLSSQYQIVRADVFFPLLRKMLGLP